MNLHNVCFLMQVELNSIMYYYCSTSRVTGLTVDGNTYLPYLQSVGDTDKIGNFGEGNQIGKCSARLMLGQKQFQGSYNINISLPWNNGSCEIRLYDLDNDSTWSDCDYYYKGVIKNFSIGADSISFDVEDLNHKDNVILPLSTVEDVVSLDSDLTTDSIPSDSLNKRIPIQYGVLDYNTTGVFAKGIALSNKVGKQEIAFDTEDLYQFTLSEGVSGLGVWENGLQRLFIAKNAYEYMVKDSSNNSIKFRADSTTTLSSAIVDSASDVSLITVSDYTKLSDLWFEDADYDSPELITGNIIAIDNELMLILEKPTSNEIWVNRGYNNTTKATHSSSAVIYWCASYAAKNLLSFTERFTPTLMTNVSKTTTNLSSAILPDWDDAMEGSLSSAIDESGSTYVKFKAVRSGPTTTGQGGHFVLADMQFPEIQSDITTANWYAAVKADFSIPYPQPTNDNLAYVIFYEPPGDGAQWRYVFRQVAGDDSDYIDGWTVLTQGDNTGLYGSTLLGSTVDPTYGEQFTSMSSLKDLNQRWRVSFFIYNGPPDIYDTVRPQCDLRIYEIGFWIDLFVNYTKHKIVGTLQGRKDNADIATIFSHAPLVTSIKDPAKAIAHLLLTDMGYTVADFDTSSWYKAHYYYSVSLYALWPTPTIAMSYGIDESSKGWALCQEIASQFGMMLVKTDSGKLKIINLYKLQDSGYYGYSSTSGEFTETHYKISLDDIIFFGGAKKINLQQTGTDRLRNMVKINYKRNNATGEYQATYPEAQSDLDSYVLTESGLTLSQARTTYYNGQKTETLEINAFAIYQAEDAERLAKWHLNDKAEVHFDVTLSLPYYHYTDKNSKTSQYDVGDIIYLDGVYQGVTFNSARLFVIQQVKKTDQGKQVQLSAKSIEPVSEF